MYRSAGPTKYVSNRVNLASLLWDHSQPWLSPATDQQHRGRNSSTNSAEAAPRTDPAQEQQTPPDYPTTGEGAFLFDQPMIYVPSESHVTQIRTLVQQTGVSFPIDTQLQGLASAAPDERLALVDALINELAGLLIEQVQLRSLDDSLQELMESCDITTKEADCLKVYFWVKDRNGGIELKATQLHDFMALNFPEFPYLKGGTPDTVQRNFDNYLNKALRKVEKTRPKLLLTSLPTRYPCAAVASMSHRFTNADAGSR
jgi:hypothetical protein